MVKYVKANNHAHRKNIKASYGDDNGSVVYELVLKNRYNGRENFNLRFSSDLYVSDIKQKLSDFCEDSL